MSFVNELSSMKQCRQAVNCDWFGWKFGMCSSRVGLSQYRNNNHRRAAFYQLPTAICNLLPWFGSRHRLKCHMILSGSTVCKWSWFIVHCAAAHVRRFAAFTICDEVKCAHQDIFHRASDGVYGIKTMPPLLLCTLCNNKIAFYVYTHLYLNCNLLCVYLMRCWPLCTVLSESFIRHFIFLIFFPPFLCRFVFVHRFRRNFFLLVFFFFCFLAILQLQLCSNQFTFIFIEHAIIISFILSLFLPFFSNLLSIILKTIRLKCDYWKLHSSVDFTMKMTI